MQGGKGVVSAIQVGREGEEGRRVVRLLVRVVKLPRHTCESRNLDFRRRGSRLRGNDEKGRWDFYLQFDDSP